MTSISDLLNCDEQDIIKARSVDLSPLLTILDDCYAHELDKEHLDKDFTEAQYNVRRSVNVNMLARNRWESEQQGRNPWVITDKNYLHLQDSVTGMYLQLHPVNPITGGVAKPADTISSRGRYLQSGCRSAKELNKLQMSEFGLAPDLSDVSLQALWKLEKDGIAITVYKPIDASKGSFSVEIPLLKNKNLQNELHFEAISENDNVLQALIMEDETMAIDNNS